MRVLLDQFPAVVSIPGRATMTGRKAMIVDDGQVTRLLVYGEGRPPVLQVDEVVTDHVLAKRALPERQREHKADTALGTVRITPGGGCGCGSTLRSYSPILPATLEGAPA